MENELPKIHVKPAHVIDVGISRIGMGSPPNGQRFMVTNDAEKSVIIFDGPTQIAKLQIDASTIGKGEVHPSKEIAVVELDSTIAFFDFQGNRVHSFEYQWPNNDIAFGFEDSGGFFFGPMPGELVYPDEKYDDRRIPLLASWSPELKINDYGNLAATSATIEFNYRFDEWFLKEPKLKGWRSINIHYGGGDFKFFNFRTVDDRIELKWFGHHDNDIAFSIDGTEIIESQEGPVRRLRIEDSDDSGFTPYNELGSVPYPFEEACYSSFYFDLVRAIFLNRVGEIYLLHTRSMKVEGKLIVEGFRADWESSEDGWNCIDEIRRCEDYMLAICKVQKMVNGPEETSSLELVNAKLVFVELEAITKALESF